MDLSLASLYLQCLDRASIKYRTPGSLLGLQHSRLESLIVLKKNQRIVIYTFRKEKKENISLVIADEQNSLEFPSSAECNEFTEVQILHFRFVL